MSKAIRIAVAAALGVAATIPALASFESYGPSTKQGQEITSLHDVNPPSLDSDPRNALDSNRSGNSHFRSDRLRSDNMVSSSRELTDDYNAAGSYLGADNRFAPSAVEGQRRHDSVSRSMWPGQTQE